MRVRITGQLIDAGSGNHIWAERKLDGLRYPIFLCSRTRKKSRKYVVAAIEPNLQMAENPARESEEPTESLDAYDLYLKIIARIPLGDGRQLPPRRTLCFEGQFPAIRTFQNLDRIVGLPCAVNNARLVAGLGRKLP